MEKSANNRIRSSKQLHFNWIKVNIIKWFNFTTKSNKLIKISVVGNSFVGKTSLIKGFCKNEVNLIYFEIFK